VKEPKFVCHRNHNFEGSTHFHSLLHFQNKPWSLKLVKMSRYLARYMVSRYFSSASSRPLHVCIVGSGPAGFYTADKVLKAHEGAHVDIIDRLPTPFGLVRSGVAPDHPETKIAINQFSRVAQHERCSFIGNVKLGSDLSLSELRDLYHVV